MFVSVSELVVSVPDPLGLGRAWAHLACNHAMWLPAQTVYVGKRVYCEECAQNSEESTNVEEQTTRKRFQVFVTASGVKSFVREFTTETEAKAAALAILVVRHNLLVDGFANSVNAYYTEVQ